MHYDVMVIGGGSAGVSAAIQAGRAGAKTLLVEKTAMLGGTTTSGGVNFPGIFHAWGRQVIAGIGWELVAQAVAEAGDDLPDFSDYTVRHWRHQVRINAFIYAALCDEKLEAAGVDVLFHTMLASIEPQTPGAGWHIQLCSKEGLIDHTAQVVIDCTGDANVAALAGFPLLYSDERQPATFSCTASGYDVDSLDIDAINRAYEVEVKAGRLGYTDVSWNTESANVGQWLHNHGNNANHIHGIDARTSQGRSKLERTARQQLLRVYRFLRTQPGLENLVIDHVAPECGVRETVRIQGKATVTVDDYQSGRVWDDAVCYSYYPIDLHTDSDQGLHYQPLEKGVVPTVPRGALLPEGSQNFIVAGRCLSSDRLANSALRVQATCMATGQAAGAMAALSAEKNLDPEQLPMSDIHTLLKQHNAIVP